MQINCFKNIIWPGLYKGHEQIQNTNLSKPNLHGTYYCVWNGQVFSLCKLNKQRFPSLRLFKVKFIQDFVLFKVWFRHVSLNKLSRPIMAMII